MRLNFSSLSGIEVDPANQYAPETTELLLGVCPDDERHRLLKLKADTLRDNLYDPDEAVQMLRCWLNRDEVGNEIGDTVRRAYGKMYEEYIVTSAKKKAPDVAVQKVVNLWHKYGGYDDLYDYLKSYEWESMLLEDWLSLLYKPDDLLCIGADKHVTQIHPLQHILWFIDGIKKNPSPLMHLLRAHLYCQLTPATFREKEIMHNGKLTGRCNPNALTRKYWVIECDIHPNVAVNKSLFGEAFFPATALMASTCKAASFVTFSMKAIQSSQ